jgi:putative tricarboxylic transport membrane protein
MKYGILGSRFHLPIILASGLAVFFAGGVLGFAPDAQAAWKPTKTLQIIVHASAGSGADQFARFVADIMDKEKILPVSAQVVNKVGGGGAIAMSHVFGKKGNDHMIMSVTNSFLTTPLKKKSKITYRDFEPVAMLALDSNAVQVLATSPYKNIHDLLKAARKKPKSISEGFGSFGGTDHIIGFQLGKATGVQFNYAGFKGGSKAVVALLGGHIDFITGGPSETLQHIKTGRIRPLAVIGDKRLPSLPDVPTLKEEGIKTGPTYSVIRGFVAPPKTPKEAVQVYLDALKKVSQSARWKKFTEDNDFVPTFLGPKEFSAFLEERNTNLAVVLKDMGYIK